MEHIVKMQYFGDAQLDKWMEMCTSRLPEDVPPDNWRRDCLYKKIRDSHLLMFDIKQYESWDEGDYRKTYRHLRNVIERAIASRRHEPSMLGIMLEVESQRLPLRQLLHRSGTRCDSGTKGQRETCSPFTTTEAAC